MKKADEYIQTLNTEYDMDLTGYSPYYGTKNYRQKGIRIIAKKFGNGLGRVIYIDPNNRLIASLVERI